MKPDNETTCPYTGHKDKCLTHFLNCPKYVHITGHDPQTGQEVDKYGCQDSFMHMLMIENTREAAHSAAATESFRNEMIKGENVLLKLIGKASQQLRIPNATD